MNHARQKTQRLIIGFGISALLGMLVMGIVFSTPNVTAQSCIPEGSTCGAGPAICCTGFVCELPGKKCESLAISINVSSTTQSSTKLDPNWTSGGTINRFSACLGNQAQCSTQPYTNTAFWTTNTVNPWNVTLNDLRPSRSYTVTGQAENNGSVAFAEQSGIVTWPGFGFTPTNADAGCVGGFCKRDIAWTTPFLADEKVFFSPDAPSWALESNPKDITKNISSLASTATGHVWGVSWYSGAIIHRDPSGTWAPQTTSTSNSLLSVSSADGIHVWAVGQFGTIISTNNGGVNWTTTTPFTARFFSHVIATSATTAWAIDDQNVYYFDGTSWVLKLTDTTANFTQIVSIDNKEVWVVSYTGTVRHTTNGWSTAPLPTWDTITPNVGDRYTSITTLDGKNLWMGGNNSVSTKAVLYRSQNGGSWISIPQIQNVVNRIDNFNQIDQESFWFSSVSKVGKFNYNGGTPVITVFSEPGIQIGADVLGLAVDKGNNILAAGQQQNISRYTQRNFSIQATAVIAGSHNIQLSSLLPATTYYYSVESVACCGFGIATGAFGGSFTTPALDTIKPTVTINPIPAFNKTCPMTISGTAADTAPGQVTGVTFDIDGTPITPTYVPSVPAGSITWTATIPCGLLTGALNHTVTAISHDGTNDSLAATASFIFDNVLPSPVTINAPAVVFATPITADGRACDNDQVATVTIKVNSALPVAAPFGPCAAINWTANNLNLNPGLNTLTVYVTDRSGNQSSATTTVTYTAPTFTLTPFPPTSQTGFAGDTFVYQVDVESIGGFIGNIAFTESGSPAGNPTTFSVNPLPLGAGQTLRINMTVNTTATSPTGTHTITITGTSGGITKTATVQLSLSGFTLVPSPSFRTVVGGFPTTYGITATANGNFTGNVTYTLSGQPTGVSGSFVPPFVPLVPASSLSTSLNISTLGTAPAGVHILTITGTSGTISRSISVTLNINAPPDINFTVTPSPIPITAGGIASYNSNVAAINGFAEAVNISSSTGVTGLSFTYTINGFTPAAAPAGTSLIINVAATSSTPSGTHPITFTAANISGTVTKSVTVDLIVSADTTPPLISNIIANPTDVDVAISWVTNEDANSRIDIYADDKYLIPISFNAVLATYCMTICHLLTSGSPLTPLTTYYFSVTSIDQAVPSGNSATVGNAGAPLQFTTTAAPDLTKPTIVITNPLSGDFITGSYPVTSVGNDDNPMSRIYLKITASGAPLPVVDTQFACSSGNSCTFLYTWNTTSVPNGVYIIEARAASSTGPAFLSDWSGITITVDNPPAPKVLCLPSQDPSSCGPEAINLLCAGGICSITIHWLTDQASSTEVEYGVAVNCAGSYTRPDGTVVPCNYTSFASDPGLVTDHFITLSNLTPDSLYHYRITSCGITNLCTN